MNLRITLLSLLSLIVLAACSDESAVDPGLAQGPSDDPESMADELYWNEDDPVDAYDASAARARRTDQGVGPTSRSYQITIENLTPNTGDGGAQVFSPPILATHWRRHHVFEVGEFASEALAGVAEDAMNGPLVEALQGSSAVADVQVGDGVIVPGSSASYQISTDAGRRFLSAVFMLVNTNDGFGGIDRLRLPTHGEVSVEVYAYDAGSEANDELFASIPGPCCGSVGTGTATHEPIRMHPGITGDGDLDPAKWGWTGAVARITVRRLAPAFEVTVRNLTPDTGDGGAQVFSPPVLATHSASIRMFRVGRLASDELAAIAEDGMNGAMVEMLESSGRALDVQTGAAPIFPSDAATFVVESERGFRRLSTAFMLVNTNDGFSGLDRVLLPRSGSVTYHTYAYDAGSEANDELFASIPGPCCGAVGAGTDTSEPIRMHEGIHGGGDLDPAKWGWEGAAAEISITRIR